MYVVTLSVFHNLAIWLLYVNKPEPIKRFHVRLQLWRVQTAQSLMCVVVYSQSASCQSHRCNSAVIIIDFCRAMSCIIAAYVVVPKMRKFCEFELLQPIFIPMMLKFKRTWETLGIPQRHKIS